MIIEQTLMDMDPNDDDDDYEDSGDVLKTLFSLTPLMSQTYVHTTQIHDRRTSTTSSQLQVLNSKFPTPSSQLQVPNSKFPTPSSQLQVPNSKFPTPSSQLQVPNSTSKFCEETRYPTATFNIVRHSLPLRSVASKHMIPCRLDAPNRLNNKEKTHGTEQWHSAHAQRTKRPRQQ
ncbi:hypothetical protein B0I73DRAFT_168289 [Yarrowia lipolytica]|nr:hypothetical protein B0I73DRAFT_168289 [Yarrowia lipolytica]